MTKKKSYIKAGYWKKQIFGIPIKFYHTDLEICYKGKIKRIGYYATNSFLWAISFIIPASGHLKREGKNHEKAIKLSANEKKVKKVLELIEDKKFHWKTYSALFKNCFHWRNSVLKEAGIKFPVKDWFNPPKR